MALLQKINIKKFLLFMKNLNDSNKTRYSIIDAQILIALCERTALSHNDLLEATEQNKSSIDRPIYRLLQLKLIEREINENAATKKGESRSIYRLTKKGMNELEKCY